MTLVSDGKDYSGVDFGENVGDVALADDAAIVTVVFIVGTGYIVYQGSKAIITYATSEEAKRHAKGLEDAIGGTFDAVIKGGKAGIDWVVETGGRMFAKQSKKSDKERSTDYPDWSNFEPPKKGEKPKKYVERILDEKYGKGNWKKGPDSEYNKILKAIERGGHKIWNAINK